MSDRLSGRALATALGVDEKAVRKAVEIGRIKKGEDGRFDLAEAREAWVRSTEPSRTKVRRSADHASPQSAPRPQADLDMLWSIVSGLPALVGWNTVLNGAGLQLAHDVAADMVLDIGGELRLRGFASAPVPFEPIDWRALAAEVGLAPVPPEVLAADYEKRRADP